MNLQDSHCETPVFDTWLQEVVERYRHLTSTQRIQTIDTLFMVSDAEQILHLNYSIQQLLQRDFITTLPVELSVKILSYVDGIDLLRCCRVNSKWNSLICSFGCLWRDLCLKNDIHPRRFLEPESKNVYNTYTENKISSSIVSALSPLALSLSRGNVQIAEDFTASVTNKSATANVQCCNGTDENNTSTSACTIPKSGQCKEICDTYLRRSSDSNDDYIDKENISDFIGTSQFEQARTLSKRVMYNNAFKNCFVELLRFRQDVRNKMKKLVHTGPKTFRGHSARVTCMHLHKGILVTGSDDRTAMFWDSAGVLLRTIECGFCVSTLIHDDTTLVCGSFTGFLKSWRIDSPDAHILQEYHGNTSAIVSVQLVRNHSYPHTVLLALFLHRIIRVYQVDTGICVYQTQVLMGDFDYPNEFLNFNLKRTMCIQIRPIDTGLVMFSIEFVMNNSVTSLINTIAYSDGVFSVELSKAIRLSQEHDSQCQCHRTDDCLVCDCKLVDYLPILRGKEFDLIVRLKTPELVICKNDEILWKYTFNRSISGLGTMRRPVYCIGGDPFAEGIGGSHELTFASSNGSDVLYWTFK